eukprot:m51a1_g5407 hypothetical protein (334) ;mRNA; f:76951-78221
MAELLGLLGESCEDIDTRGAVVLISDIHGHLDKIRSLWASVRSSCESLYPDCPESFTRATVVFLGDYIDRGPKAKETIEWLRTLDEEWPEQRHVFLSGNHDHAFGSFIGALPVPPPPSDGLPGSPHLRPGEILWDGGDILNSFMHLQGRRYGGSAFPGGHSLYSCENTWISYGAGATAYETRDRDALARLVPEEHKRFIASLDLAKVLRLGRRGYLICVHAGLLDGQDVCRQLRSLLSRDTSAPRLPQLSGRGEVLRAPRQLVECDGVAVVSAHHGFFELTEPHRLVIDKGGGLHSLPICAAVLPPQQHVDGLPGAAESFGKPLFGAHFLDSE